MKVAAGKYVTLCHSHHRAGRAVADGARPWKYQRIIHG